MAREHRCKQVTAVAFRAHTGPRLDEEIQGSLKATTEHFMDDERQRRQV